MYFYLPVHIDGFEEESDSKTDKIKLRTVDTNFVACIIAEWLEFSFQLQKYRLQHGWFPATACMNINPIMVNNCCPLKLYGLRLSNVFLIRMFASDYCWPIMLNLFNEFFGPIVLLFHCLHVDYFSDYSSALARLERNLYCMVNRMDCFSNLIVLKETLHSVDYLPLYTKETTSMTVCFPAYHVRFKQGSFLKIMLSRASSLISELVLFERQGSIFCQEFLLLKVFPVSFMFQRN